MDLMVATVADLIFEGCFCSQAPRRTSELFNAFSFHANGDPIYAPFVPELPKPLLKNSISAGTACEPHLFGGMF